MIPKVSILLPFVCLKKLFDKPLRLPTAFVSLWDQLEVQVIQILLKIKAKLVGTLFSWVTKTFLEDI